MRLNGAGNHRRMLLVALGLSGALVLSGCAANPETPRGEVGLIPYDGPLPDGLVLSDKLPEEYATDPIDLATMEWLTRIQLVFAQDPNFGSPAISPDRTTVTLPWFGTPSTQLEQMIAEAPADLTVVLQSAAFRPGELTELAQKAVTTRGLVPDVQVAMGGANPDASGIMIGIVKLPTGRTLDSLGAEFAKALNRPDIPVTVEVSGEMIPISE